MRVTARLSVWLEKRLFWGVILCGGVVVRGRGGRVLCCRVPCGVWCVFCVWVLFASSRDQCRAAAVVLSLRATAWPTTHVVCVGWLCVSVQRCLSRWMDGASAGLTPLSPDVECALGVTCHVLLRTYVRVTARDCLSGLKNDFLGV